MTSCEPLKSIPDVNRAGRFAPLSLTATGKKPEYSEQIGNLYRNTKYRFTIKFPEGWEIKPGDGPNIVQKAVSGYRAISVGVRVLSNDIESDSMTIKDIIPFDEYKVSQLGNI